MCAPIRQHIAGNIRPGGARPASDIRKNNLEKYCQQPTYDTTNATTPSEARCVRHQEILRTVMTLDLSHSSCRSMSSLVLACSFGRTRPTLAYVCRSDSRAPCRGGKATRNLPPAVSSGRTLIHRTLTGRKCLYTYSLREATVHRDAF